MASDTRRVFSDPETALILQKAAELQAERGGRSSGLTLEELRQVASEAGIEPHLVDEAWTELSRRAAAPAPSKRKSRRGQTRWEQRVELPVRLDNEGVRAVLAHLEAEFGEHGTVTEMSCGTVWTQYRPRDGHTHAAIEATEAGTRLHIALERSTEHKFMRRVGGAIGGVAGALYTSFIYGVEGVLPGIGGPFYYYYSPGTFLILTGLGIVLGNLCGRGAWRLIARRWAERLDRLISTLSDEARRNGTPVSAPSASWGSGPEAAARSGQEAAHEADRP